MECILIETRSIREAPNGFELLGMFGKVTSHKIVDSFQILKYSQSSLLDFQSSTHIVSASPIPCFGLSMVLCLSSVSWVVMCFQRRHAFRRGLAEISR